MYSYDDYSRVSGKTAQHVDTTDLNVLEETFTYRNPVEDGATSQVETYRTASPAGYDVTYSYTYDGNGNILTVSDGTNTTGYVYDTANQLLRENNQAAGKTWGYVYDDAGNILRRLEYAYTTGELGEPTDTVVYTYGDEEWGDLLTACDGQTITHDAIGNPLTDGTWTYTWEHGRELASMTDGETTWDYTYNADGLRTKRTNGTTTYNYLYLNGQLVKETIGETAMYFAYDADGKPMSVLYNDVTYYYVTNLQGDVVAILSNTGELVVSYSYDAWGNPLSTSGTMADTLGTHNPLRYRGYVYDAETGLYYVSSRYYDPEIGRWINADIPETLTADFENFAQYNLFAYCFNNPVNMSDETGTWPSWAKKVVAAVAVVAVVAAVAAVTVATAGAGTAAAVIAVGAAKGAAIGMASGAAIGAATGAVSHRVSTGSWSGAGTAALNGMGDGALSGAVTGAITGAAGSAVKVSQAAKAWDSGTFKSGYQSMKYHYNKHVVSEGLTKGNNVLKYTQDAVRFANRNSSVLKYTYNYNYGNASWNLTYSTGQGGMFTSAGKILTFWYR